MFVCVCKCVCVCVCVCVYARTRARALLCRNSSDAYRLSPLYYIKPYTHIKFYILRCAVGRRKAGKAGAETGLGRVGKGRWKRGQRAGRKREERG